MITYVLGAGASRDIGYPFARSMGSGLFSWMERNKPSGPYDFRWAAKSLRERFDDVEDIETLLTNIEKTIKQSRRSLQKRVQCAGLANHDRPALLVALRQWFCAIRRKSAGTYRSFARHVVKPGDCIITFNYNVSLDRELKRAGLWKLGDGYGFQVNGFDGGSQIRLLKLHGSINWLASMYGGVTRGLVVPTEGVFGSRPVFDDSEIRFLGFDSEDPLFPRPGTPGIPPLILPTRCKKFYFETNLGGRDWTGFWNDLWRAAAVALKKSSHVVICGYSVPDVDKRACRLLFKQTSNTTPIEVCCGDDTARIVETFRACDRTVEPANELYFSEWTCSRMSTKAC